MFHLHFRTMDEALARIPEGVTIQYEEIQVPPFRPGRPVELCTCNPKKPHIWKHMQELPNPAWEPRYWGFLERLAREPREGYEDLAGVVQEYLAIPEEERQTIQKEADRKGILAAQARMMQIQDSRYREIAAELIQQKREQFRNRYGEEV